MREYKFRAWDGKKMYLPEYSDEEDFFICSDGEIRYIKEVGYERHNLTFSRKGWVLMQYIGWKDKDNNDVYEGDQIEIYWLDGDVTCEVITYSEEYGYFMYGNNPICELKDPIRPFKVIGNIYSNAAGQRQPVINMTTDPKEGQETPEEVKQPEGQEQAETLPDAEGKEG